MHVIVYAPEGMDQGHVYLCRELADDEIMDARTFADKVAEERGTSIHNGMGRIPSCCGDIRVEFTDHKPVVTNGRYQGSTRIWSGESYYFGQDDA